jgi:hypothetical protein
LPLFEIARKRLGVTWFVHLPGSKEKDDPRPVATVVPQWHMLKDKFDVHFSNAAGGDSGREEIVLSVRGQDIWKSRTHVYYGDALVMTSKLKDMVAVYVPGKRPEWEIEVAEGVDLSLVCRISWLVWRCCRWIFLTWHRLRLLECFWLLCCTRAVCCCRNA